MQKIAASLFVLAGVAMPLFAQATDWQYLANKAEGSKFAIDRDSIVYDAELNSGSFVEQWEFPKYLQPMNGAPDSPIIKISNNYGCLGKWYTHIKAQAFDVDGVLIGDFPRGRKEAYLFTGADIETADSQPPSKTIQSGRRVVYKLLRGKAQRMSDELYAAVCPAKPVVDVTKTKGSAGLGVLPAPDPKTITGLTYETLPNIVYPEAARSKNFEGVALIRVLVNAKGRVEKAIIFSSAENDDLDQAAIEAAKGVRFIPSTENGVARSVIAVVPIEFKLDDKVVAPEKPKL